VKNNFFENSKNPAAGLFDLGPGLGYDFSSFAQKSFGSRSLRMSETPAPAGKARFPRTFWTANTVELFERAAY